MSSDESVESRSIVENKMDERPKRSRELYFLVRCRFWTKFNVHNVFGVLKDMFSALQGRPVSCFRLDLCC